MNPNKKKPGRPLGAGHKLDYAKVAAMRDAYRRKSETKATLRKLGREFGVSGEMVRKIILGLVWRGSPEQVPAGE
jgi:hypothetical protein